MPIFTLANSVEYFFTDSGVPNTHTYTTYFIIHGHSFHSGVFRRILPTAYKQSHRMIAINRRDYLGSTPYTKAELDVFADGSDEQRMSLLLREGTNLALLLDGLIESLSLPPKVVIVGWSLGNTYMMSMLTSISESSLPKSARERLALSVHKIIMWDFPAHCMGINVSPTYLPLLDMNLSLEARGLVFLRNWSGYYFLHDSLSKRDVTLLDQGFNFNGFNRKNTFQTPPEELTEIIDFGPGPRCDNFLVQSFREAENIITHKALFDISTRSAWGGLRIWNLIGDASMSSVHLGAWFLEDKVQVVHEELRIHFSVAKGVNHFEMWDDPESCMKRLESCT